MDKLQWNFNRNSHIFNQENALEYVVCKMTSILSRPQRVNDTLYSTHSLCLQKYIDIVPIGILAAPNES